MSEAITKAAETLADTLDNEFVSGRISNNAGRNAAQMLRQLCAALSPAGQADDEQDAKWRDVALRFDRHRMQALWHLQAMLQDPAKHADVVRQFLKDPSHPDVQGGQGGHGEGV